MKSVLITFSGIDGAGKSTQIEKLREYLKSEGIAFRLLAFWDNVAVFRNARSGFSRHVLQSDGKVGAPGQPAARRDKNLQSWPLYLGRSILHVLDVINLRRVVIRERRRGGIVIFDRYIYDQLAALPLDHWWARAFARLLLRIAPTPDVSYLLDAVPEAARLRKPEYPLEFMHKYRSSYLELRRFTHLELIPASVPEDVHLAVLECFKTATAWAPEPEMCTPLIA